tara:strand:- start:1864 stop:2241 length:378 start_codon:yes stop_codon:yes gene_type:complete
MKILFANICLILTIFVASVGISANADFQKRSIALTELTQRNGLFYKFLSPTPYTGKVWGQKTGYLKNGRWDGDYVEVSAIKGFTLRGTYRNGVRIGEWNFLINTQTTKLSISAEYENGVIKINEK